jgi:hypothetical protein
MRLIYALFVLCVASLSTSSTFAEPLVLIDEFHAAESGGASQTLFRLRGAAEAVATITAGCAALGINCAQQAAQIHALSIKTRDVVANGNYTGTAVIKDHVGDIWHAFFNTPVRNKLLFCKAAVNLRNASVSGGATFNTTVSANQRSLQIYAVVPQGSGTGQNADFVVATMWVTAGELAAYGCWPPKTVVSRCKGSKCEATLKF